MHTNEPTYQELLELREVARLVDDLLEASLRARENLEQTFRRVFPPLCTRLKTTGMALTTSDEEAKRTTFHHGDFGGVFAGTVLTGARFGVAVLDDGSTLVSQALDVAGASVGALGMRFAGDRSAEAAHLARLVETVAEELDTVLASVHTAIEKHRFLVDVSHLLSNRVFEAGMDGAVRALSEKVSIPGFLLLFRDAVESGALHYRVYRNGQLESASNGRRHPLLDECIRQNGRSLLSGTSDALRELLGDRRALETVLISGHGDAAMLGKIMAWSGGDGFSAYTIDLLRLLAGTLSQRLIDYNRERIHLSQFFSPATIDALLAEPDYERRYLTPRAEEVGMLFADINGFTRICERVLERPERIGRFVDDWSTEAVRIVFRHGGVFDKMVGDCIIGLFGPPFFSGPPASRARAAVQAAVDIQRFTQTTMSAHPELARLSEVLGQEGLGVAIGVSLAVSYCGLFGPNRNYTSFSTGMNQTARLQSLGGFRETLVMERVKATLDESGDSERLGLPFGPLEEATVKNVAQPLRFHRMR